MQMSYKQNLSSSLDSTSKSEAWSNTVFTHQSLNPNWGVMAASMIQTSIFTEFLELVTGCCHFELVESQLWVET
jgi:hypothetical protein